LFAWLHEPTSVQPPHALTRHRSGSTSFGACEVRCWRWLSGNNIPNLSLRTRGSRTLAWAPQPSSLPKLHGQSLARSSELLCAHRRGRVRARSARPPSMAFLDPVVASASAAATVSTRLDATKPSLCSSSLFSESLELLQTENVPLSSQAPAGVLPGIGLSRCRAEILAETVVSRVDFLAPPCDSKHSRASMSA